ncbi:MAG TPA: hypothetical protein VIB82_00875 [Caulobacteraceae bacterium]|jgi:hypothetical protein
MSNPPPAAGPSPEQLKKKARAARLAKVSGVVFGAVILIRGLALVLPHGLPHCDDSAIQSAATGLLNKSLAERGATGLNVKSLTEIKDGDRSDRTAKCTAVLTVSDNSKGLLSYQIERGEGGDRVHITNVQPDG